mgnify:CR=1 FL=1
MKSWTEKTKEQSAIESKGFHERVKPILNRITDSYETFDPDTYEQKTLKVDGIAKTKNTTFYFENKIVNGNYSAIFGEYMAVPDCAPPKSGWIEIASRVDKPTVLIYAMLNTVYIYNMDKLKDWYQVQDKSKWRESKIRDYKFNQDMYGYLIPVSEIDQFKIAEFKIA